MTSDNGSTDTHPPVPVVVDGAGGKPAVSVVKWVLGGVGLAGMLALAPFFLSSGLVAPLWAVIVLIVIWVGLLALGIGLMIRRRPIWVLPLPVLAAGVWFGGVTLGSVLLGWTA